MSDSSSDEAEFEGTGEDAEVIIDNSNHRSSRSIVNYAEGEDDYDEDESDEDDDDIPLAALKSPSPAKKKKVASTAKAKAPAKKKAKKTSSTKSTSSTTKSGSASTSSNDYSSPSFALYGTNSAKGQLIQKLLCRWWYAIEWPDPSDIPDKTPPDHDAMDGFPGLFICTQGEDVGKIMDCRDKAKAPNFINFAKKTSEELRELLIDAITEQKRQLCESEGEGTSMESELNSMLKWAKKLNPTKADKEAAKVLKANKLTISE